MLICLLYVFGEMSFHVFCPFSNWSICFFTVKFLELKKYIIDISPLLDMLFANIFSHCVAFLLTLTELFTQQTFKF